MSLICESKQLLVTLFWGTSWSEKTNGIIKGQDLIWNWLEILLDLLLLLRILLDLILLLRILPDFGLDIGLTKHIAHVADFL